MECEALGYRAIVTAKKIVDDPRPGESVFVPNGNTAQEIVPYKCSRRDCPYPSVVRARGRYLCSAHR